jgi:hypothetical protein
MNEQNPASAGLETRQKSAAWTRLRKIATTIGASILGAIVGFGVQTGIGYTGLAGPSVETLLAEQEENFTDVHAKLDALQAQATDPAVRQTAMELEMLLQRQNELSQQAGAELRSLSEQAAVAKDSALAEGGTAGGADFWLKPGESVNLGAREQVFGLTRVLRGGYADVNLSGTAKRMSVGDMMSVEAGARMCTVFFKQAVVRADGRVGFDVNCA